MTDWRPAPAARALLDQATARSPQRSKASDGLLGDPAHSARRSRHNPDERGVVLAVDLTHDPRNGIDAHLVVRDAVERWDPRVLEAISRGRIWTKARAAEGWRDYAGSNPHDKHAHVSIDRAHEDDTSPWWPQRSRPGVRITEHRAPIEEDHVFVAIDDDKDLAWLVHPWREEKRPIKGALLTLLAAGSNVVRGPALTKEMKAELATFKTVL